MTTATGTARPAAPSGIAALAAALFGAAMGLSRLALASRTPSCAH